MKRGRLEEIVSKGRLQKSGNGERTLYINALVYRYCLYRFRYPEHCPYYLPGWANNQE